MSPGTPPQKEGKLNVRMYAFFVFLFSQAPWGLWDIGTAGDVNMGSYGIVSGSGSNGYPEKEGI